MTALGVYTVVADGFSLREALENAVTASLVLLAITPLTVGGLLELHRLRRHHDIRLRTHPPARTR
ncbi:hypothetical protein ABZ569_28155 [Streptomyces albus]|uniref:hypothetical protein n=1 Tax=Streptomyces albus TaxID=1888 RepID=UPI0033EA8234